MFALTALTTTTPYFKLLDDPQSFRMIKVLSQDPENRVSPLQQFVTLAPGGGSHGGRASRCDRGGIESVVDLDKFDHRRFWVHRLRLVDISS
jgi:hypothetical protein